jgi:acyl carrier protein
MENNKKEAVYAIIKNVIESYSIEIGKIISNVTNETRLVGASSLFDSSDLVQIIVEVEDRINSKFNTDLTLTDEKAMSRSTSPFINVETFARFITERLDEE